MTLFPVHRQSHRTIKPLGYALRRDLSRFDHRCPIDIPFAGLSLFIVDSFSASSFSLSLSLWVSLGVGGASETESVPEEIESEDGAATWASRIPYAPLPARRASAIVREKSIARSRTIPPPHHDPALPPRRIPIGEQRFS